MAMQGKGTGTDMNKGKAGGNGLGTQDPQAIVREIIDCFNRRDWDRAMSMVARDAKWLNVPFNRTYEGHDQFRHSMTDWVDGFPDAKMDVKSIVAQGGTVVVEFIGRGTHSGTLSGPNGSLAPTGKKVELPFVEMYEIHNGQVHGGRLYFDSGSMMRQLGILK